MRATVNLVSMWVAPAYHRAGVGHRLVEATLGWATETGAGSVELWVTHENRSAAGLYRKVGFKETTDHQPLPSDPCTDEVRMVFELPDRGRAHPGG